MMNGNLFNFPSHDSYTFMRLFISIDVEEYNTRDSLSSFINKLSEFHGVKPVSPDKLHITLAFLGNVDEDKVTEVQDSFMTVTNNVNIGTFTCTIEDVGVFPHMSYIEVIWAGAKPERELNELHMKYTEGMNFINEQYEDDFVPHVTLGRVKHMNNHVKSKLQDLVREHNPTFGAFDVGSVRLKESRLTDDGPIYQDIAVCEL